MELEVNDDYMKNKGFTLIELIIALTIFSLVIISMAAITVSMIKSQRKTFALQNIQEPARYISESMSKEIRMSQINSLDSGGSQRDILNITNDKNENVDYRFIAANRLQRQVDGGGWQYLSPANLEVTGGFYISKSSSPDRAKVTIVMQIKSTGAKVEEQAEVYLQSTISQRSY